MSWPYLKNKKYQLILAQIREITDVDLDPNAATAEEMEGGFELLPQLIEKLKDIYYEDEK